MDWATLFERAAGYDVTEAAVREALSARRAGGSGEDAGGEDPGDAGGGADGGV
jgi:hypothetical protein